MVAALPPTLPPTLPPSPLPLPLPRLQPSPPPPPCPLLLLLLFWLIVVCPHAASATGTVSLPPPLPLLASDAIVTDAAVANRCPLLLPPQPRPLCIPLFSLMMFKILLRPSIILNIFHVTFWLIVVCPRTAFAFATVDCPCRCVFANHLGVITTCAASTVSCLSLTTKLGGGRKK